MDDLQAIDALDTWGLTNFPDIAALREKIRVGGIAALSKPDHETLLDILATIPHLNQPITFERRGLNVGNYVRYGGETRIVETE